MQHKLSIPKRKRRKPDQDDRNQKKKKTKIKLLIKVGYNLSNPKVSDLKSDVFFLGDSGAKQNL